MSSHPNSQHSQHSSPFLRLHQQARKNKPFQHLTQPQIKQLTHQITTQQKDKLLRFILKQKSFFQRSIIDVYILMACVSKYKFFESILENKGEKALQEFCKHLYYSKIQKNKYLFEIGEIADKFYILMNGTVMVQVMCKEEGVGDAGEMIIQEKLREAHKYSKGEMFGETISKESISRRAISVLTETDCEFFEIRKKDYEIVYKYMTISPMRQKYMFFEQIDIFSRLSKGMLETMLYLTKLKQVRIGHVVYNQNQYLDEIYIVKEGEFKLETTICGKLEGDEMDELKKLKSKTMMNSRKFQTMIVGAQFVLGQIDAMMDVRTKESCTCITQKAGIYVVKKKDLMMHLSEDRQVDKLISSKFVIRGERLKCLNQTFNHNNSIKNMFAYRRDHFGQREAVTSHYHHKNSKSFDSGKASRSPQLEFLRNQYKSNSSSKTSQSKISRPLIRKSLHKRSATEESEQSQQHVSEISKINYIIKQKKKYSKIRNNNDEPLFKFSSEIPVFLRVKMGVTESSLRLDEGKNQSSKTLTGFPSSLKLSKTMKPARKYLKKQERVSANSNTIYGKFFQLLLDV